MKLLNNFKLFTTLQIFCCLLPFYGFGQVVPVTSQTQTVTQPYNTSGHVGFLGLGAVNTETPQTSALYFFAPQKQLHLKQFVLRRSSPATTDVPTVRLTAIGVGGQNWTGGGGGPGPDPLPDEGGPAGLYSTSSDFNDWFENAQHHWDMEGRTNGFSILHTPHGQTVQNRFNITSAGLIGIAEQSPLSRLHVRGVDNQLVSTISRFVSNDGTNGVAIGMNSISAIGSTTDQSIFINSKGNGSVAIGIPIGSLTKGNFQVAGTTVMGTKAPLQHTDFKLAVEGKIVASEVVVIPPSSTPNFWADFVFDSSYKLMPIAELEKYIAKNRHLPDVPSEKEVKANGVDLLQVNKDLLRKVEELTLYLINQEKRLKELESKVFEVNN
jgi:hypothetical protein